MNVRLNAMPRRLEDKNGRLGRFLQVVFFGLFVYLCGNGSAEAQILPITDVVPFDDLDVRQSDILNLMRNYTDALKEQKVAKLNLDALNSLRASTVVSQLEMQIAQLNLQVAETKIQIVRAVGEKQLAAAKAKLEILQQMEKVGSSKTSTGENTTGKARSIQAESTVKILQMILDTQL